MATLQQRRDNLKSIIDQQFGVLVQPGAIDALLYLIDYNFENLGQSGVIEDHIFASETARDTFFTATPEVLTMGLPIIVNTGTIPSPDVRVQIWVGDNQPDTYPSPITTEWADAGGINLTPAQVTVVVGLTAVDEGYIPLRTATSYQNSSLRELADRIVSDKSIEVPPGSIFIGESIRISGANKALNVLNEALNRRGLLVTQLFDDTGSTNPIALDFGNIEQTVIQSVDTVDNTDTVIEFPITLTADRFIQSILFRPLAASSTANLEIRLNDTNGDTIYTEDFSIAATQETEQLDLSNPVIFNNGDTIYVIVTCEGLKGGNVGPASSFIPYIALRNFIFTEDTVISESTLGSEMNDRVVGGTGITAAYDAQANELTISLTSTVINTPLLTHFTINIPSRVDLNTDLNNQRDITYDLIYATNVQSLLLEVSDGDNKVLTVPTVDGNQSAQVILSGIDTSTNKTLTFKITGVDSESNAFESNTHSVSVADPVPQELLYYGTSATNNPDTIVISTLNTVDANTGQVSVSTGAVTQGHYFMILAPTDHDVTSIVDTVLQQEVISIFTKSNNIRMIGGVNYNSFVIGPLNADVDGESYTLTLN